MSFIKSNYVFISSLTILLLCLLLQSPSSSLPSLVESLKLQCNVPVRDKYYPYDALTFGTSDPTVAPGEGADCVIRIGPNVTVQSIRISLSPLNQIIIDGVTVLRQIQIVNVYFQESSPGAEDTLVYINNVTMPDMTKYSYLPVTSSSTQPSTTTASPSTSDFRNYLAHRILFNTDNDKYVVFAPYAGYPLNYLDTAVFDQRNLTCPLIPRCRVHKVNITNNYFFIEENEVFGLIALQIEHVQVILPRGKQPTGSTNRDGLEGIGSFLIQNNQFDVFAAAVRFVNCSVENSLIVKQNSIQVRDNHQKPGQANAPLAFAQCWLRHSVVIQNQVRRDAPAECDLIRTPSIVLSGEFVFDSNVFVSNISGSTQSGDLGGSMAAVSCQSVRNGTNWVITNNVITTRGIAGAGISLGGLRYFDTLLIENNTVDVRGETNTEVMLGMAITFTIITLNTDLESLADSNESMMISNTFGSFSYARKWAKITNNRLTSKIRSGPFGMGSAGCINLPRATHIAQYFEVSNNICVVQTYNPFDATMPFSSEIGTDSGKNLTSIPIVRFVNNTVHAEDMQVITTTPFFLPPCYNVQTLILSQNTLHISGVFSVHVGAFVVNQTEGTDIEVTDNTVNAGPLAIGEAFEKAATGASFFVIFNAPGKNFGSLLIARNKANYTFAASAGFGSKPQRSFVPGMFGFTGVSLIGGVGEMYDKGLVMAALSGFPVLPRMVDFVPDGMNSRIRGNVLTGVQFEVSDNTFAVSFDDKNINCDSSFLYLSHWFFAFDQVIQVLNNNFAMERLTTNNNSNNQNSARVILQHPPGTRRFFTVAYSGNFGFLQISGNNFCARDGGVLILTDPYSGFEDLQGAYFSGIKFENNIVDATTTFNFSVKAAAATTSVASSPLPSSGKDAPFFLVYPSDFFESISISGNVFIQRPRCVVLSASLKSGFVPIYTTRENSLLLQGTSTTRISDSTKKKSVQIENNQFFTSSRNETLLSMAEQDNNNNNTWATMSIDKYFLGSSSTTNENFGEVIISRNKIILGKRMNNNNVSTGSNQQKIKKYSLVSFWEDCSAKNNNNNNCIDSEMNSGTTTSVPFTISVENNQIECAFSTFGMENCSLFDVPDQRFIPSTSSSPTSATRFNIKSNLLSIYSPAQEYLAETGSRRPKYLVDASSSVAHSFFSSSFSSPTTSRFEVSSAWIFDVSSSASCNIISFTIYQRLYPRQKEKSPWGYVTDRFTLGGDSLVSAIPTTTSANSSSTSSTASSIPQFFSFSNPNLPPQIISEPSCKFTSSSSNFPKNQQTKTHTISVPVPTPAPAPTIAPALAKASKITSSVQMGAVAASAGAVPALAFSVARQQAMMSVTGGFLAGDCSGMDPDQPAPADSPTGMSIGSGDDDPARFVVGAVVGNIVLGFGILIFFQAVAMVVYHAMHPLRSSEKVDPDDVDFTQRRRFPEGSNIDGNGNNNKKKQNNNNCKTSKRRVPTTEEFYNNGRRTYSRRDDVEETLDDRPNFSLPLLAFARSHISTIVFVLCSILFTPTLSFALVLVTQSNVNVGVRIVIMLTSLLFCVAPTCFYLWFCLFKRKRIEVPRVAQKPDGTPIDREEKKTGNNDNTKGQGQQKQEKDEQNKNKNKTIFDEVFRISNKIFGPREEWMISKRASQQEFLAFQIAVPVIEGYRASAPWFSAVEYGCQVGMALSSFFANIIGEGMTTCYVEVGILIASLAIFLILCLWFMPFQERGLAVIIPGITLLQILIVTIAAIFQQNPPPWLDSLIEVTLSLQSVISVIALVMTLGPLVMPLTRVIRRLSKGRDRRSAENQNRKFCGKDHNKNNKRNANDDDDDYFAVAITAAASRGRNSSSPASQSGIRNLRYLMMDDDHLAMLAPKNERSQEMEARLLRQELPDRKRKTGSERPDKNNNLHNGRKKNNNNNNSNSNRASPPSHKPPSASPDESRLMRGRQKSDPSCSNTRYSQNSNTKKGSRSDEKYDKMADDYLSELERNDDKTKSNDRRSDVSSMRRSVDSSLQNKGKIPVKSPGGKNNGSTETWL